MLSFRRPAPEFEPRYRATTAGASSSWECLAAACRVSPLPDRLQVDRRAVLGGLAAAAAITAAAPSEAAYGDAARVFAGNVTNQSGAAPPCSSDCQPGSTAACMRSKAGVLSLFSAICTCRLHPLRRRWLCRADPLQVEPLQGAGLPRHRAQVRLPFFPMEHHCSLPRRA
jgi:hypothetical protein